MRGLVLLMSLRLSAVLAAIGASGCATRGPDYSPGEFPGDERIRTNIADDRSPAPSAKPSRLDTSPMRQAAAIENGVLCEGTARSSFREQPRASWALLAACVRQHDFTDIFRLTSAPWLEEIKKRGLDGLVLASRVVAQRGGDLRLDIAHLNGQGIQIFDLADAMENPRIFRGRHVVMRGRIIREDPLNSGLRLHIVETSLEAENVTDSMTSWNVDREVAKGRSREALVDRSAGGRRRIVVSSRSMAAETGREIFAMIEASGAAVTDEDALREGPEHASNDSSESTADNSAARQGRATGTDIDIDIDIDIDNDNGRGSGVASGRGGGIDRKMDSGLDRQRDYLFLIKFERTGKNPAGARPRGGNLEEDPELPKAFGTLVRYFQFGPPELAPKDGAKR